MSTTKTPFNYEVGKEVVSNQKSMLEAMLESVGNMEQMMDEMKNMKQDVEQTKEDIDKFKKDFEDNNRLLPGEVDDLYNNVCDRSIKLVRQMGIQDEEEFKKEVGKTRRRIWTKLKKNFGISKYINLQRKYYDEAMDFSREIKWTDLM